MRDTDDLYRILQVDPSAESETIEAAYKALAKKYHPDRNPSLDATQETQRLNHARDVLLNPRQRDKYDHKRRPADKGEQARQEAVRQRAAAERQARQETERRKDAERKVLSAQAEARKQADAAGKARKARAEEQHQRVRAEERVEVERRARTEAERRAAAEQRTREAAEESARKAWKMARRRASGESRRWSAWLMAAPVVLILAAAAAMLWNHPVQERIQSQGSQEPEPIQSQVGPPEPEPIQSQTLRSPGYLDEPAVAAAAMLWPAGAAYVDEVYEAERRQRREERRPGRVFRDCDRCPNMVVVPPGTFRMGSNDGVRTHQPLRDVRVRMFALGRYEVTVEEYATFVTASGHVEADGCYVTDRRGRTVWDPQASWRAPGFEQVNEQPVVCVSWRDAQAYARWVSRESGQSYRLASEAEWEYAARAGMDDVDRGTDETAQCDLGNGGDRTTRRFFPEWRGITVNCSDDNAFTAPVGSYAPNALGLFDMLGNAWEWTEDCWHDNYRGAPSDAAAWTSAADCRERVLRGGSWQDSSRRLAPAVRNRYSTGLRSLSSVGFRIARTMD